MNKKFSKLLLTSASAVALLAAYPSVAQNANEALGLDLPSITAEAATTAGNAFVKRVMDLPNVSTIASKTPEEIEDHGRDMRSIRRAYNRLSAADKKDATVKRWEGYLYQKERAIGNVFVDIIMDLHTIAEIEEFDTADFAAEQKAARRARNQYNDLSQVAKENASVVKWLEYLDQKEQPLGITFVDLVGAVPNVSTLEGLTEEELEVANKSVAAAEASYDKLSDAAKADALVEKWLGYLANKKEAIAALEVIEEELSVESVSAINATQVEVKFNQPVDKNDAESGKVSIQGVTFAGNGVLSADGKTLTLTANAAIDVKNAAVVVEPISSKANALVKTEKYVGLMTYKDEVAPTIVSVEAKTNGTVATQATIKVSEPVKNGALIKVNGSYASVNFNNTDTAVVTGVNLEAGKTHTVELINLEDLAGNKTVSTSASFTVSVDTVAPTATLSTQSDKNIVVTFNKSMNVSATEAALGNGVVKDEALADVTTGPATVVADSDNKQFLIPVTNALYTNKDSRTLNVVLKDTIVDALGNKLVPTTQSVTLTKDTTKPVATGYDVIREADGKVKSIVVNFSEGLKASGALDSILAGQTLHQAATSIVNENGVAETAKFGNYKSKAVANGDKKVVFEATTAEKVNGKYAISFKTELVKDLSEAGNKSAAFSYTIDFGQDQSVTTFDVTSASASASNNVIIVNFPEAVKGGAVANSATDIANYTLAGKALSAGTTITLDGAQKVATITLPTESVAKDDRAAIFTVANVKNTAGTKTVKSYTGTVDVKDNVKPVLESAKALDNKTIELTYSEAIGTLIANTDVYNAFDIKHDNVSMGLTTGQLKANNVSGFANKIRITVDKGTDVAGTKEVNTLTIANAAGTAAGNITVTFSDGGDNIVKTVAVAHNDTNAVVATKVASAFSDLAGYDVTASTNTVVFTAKQAAADKTVTVSVADTGTTGVGTPSASQTTAGAAPTFATILDFTKAITVETKAAVIKDKASTPNTQKEDVKVTVVKPN